MTSQLHFDGICFFVVSNSMLRFTLLFYRALDSLLSIQEIYGKLNRILALFREEGGGVRDEGEYFVITDR